MAKQGEVEFADLLAGQAQHVSEQQLVEYRRRLEEKLGRVARNEKRMRIAILVMALVAVVGVVTLVGIGSLVGRFPLGFLFDNFPAVAVIILATIYGCGVSVVLFSALYFLHYRPRLQRAESEQILATMLDLQRQIQALADRLPPESKHEIRSTQSETDPEHE